MALIVSCKQLLSRVGVNLGTLPVGYAGLPFGVQLLELNIGQLMIRCEDFP